MTRAWFGAMMLVVGVVATSPMVAGAQGVERPLIGIAAGADLHGATGSPNVWLVQASAQWRQRTSGLGFRAELSYLERGRERETLLLALPCPFPGCPPLEVMSRIRGVSAMLSGTFELLRSAPVRPYVLSGVGVLTTRTSIDVNGGIPPCPECAFAARPARPSGLVTPSQSTTSVILNGGAGILFDVGRAQLFTELRYQLADEPTIRGLSGIAPLTLGIRF